MLTPLDMRTRGSANLFAPGYTLPPCVVNAKVYPESFSAFTDVSL